MVVLKDIAEHLDPELRAVFRATPVATTLAERRQGLAALSQKFADALPEPRPIIEDVEVPAQVDAVPVPLRIFRPRDGRSDTILLWMHGGAFTAGDHRDDAHIAGPIVQATGCTVVSVGYRLAPEHRAPAAFEDCYAALCWVARESTRILGRPGRKLVVGGISAGGCLAAAVVQAARDRNGPKIDFQLLLIPALDHRQITQSSQAIDDPRAWGRSRAFEAWSLYAGPEFEQQVPEYTAPATAADLSGLPPAYLEIAGMDPLRDEAIQYGNRLMQAGVGVEMHVYAGAYHASTLIQPAAEVSRRAHRDMLSALTRALEGFTSAGPVWRTES